MTHPLLTNKVVVSVKRCKWHPIQFALSICNSFQAKFHSDKILVRNQPEASKMKMNPSLIKTVFHIFKQRIGISVEKLLRPARKFDLQWILSIFRTNRVQLFFPPGPPLTLYGFHPGISPLCSCSMRSFRPSKIVENVQSLMLAQSHINDVTPQTHTLWTLWCDISTKTNMSNRMVQRGE
ncbi:unnamed protein product [Albugo candida]|uniref:Uncharacterized protein n=1 Tax=Albugo candida TaxID=65357 RepID=A0A024FV88_9STRA|nr:unnamed protein product [Albugo candida]|eukprot:CCI11020.1 unnamed protein product [Albugo candida]